MRLQIVLMLDFQPSDYEYTSRLEDELVRLMRCVGERLPDPPAPTAGIRNLYDASDTYCGHAMITE